MPHAHMISRTTDDYEAMAAAGVVALIEPAFWIGQPRTHVGTYIDYLSAIVGWERFRAGQFGIRHYCTIGLNSKEANNQELAEGVMEILPRFALKEGVVAIGEIGYDEQTDLEDKYFRLQLELAKELELPVMIHTPHRDKKRGTTRSMDVIEEHGLPPSQVVIDHNNEETVQEVLERGYWAAFSIYPSTKMGNERMVEIVRQYGPERIIVDSACDWGISEPLGVAKTATLALQRGIPEEHVAPDLLPERARRVRPERPDAGGRLAEPAGDRPAHAVRGQLDPARRPRAAGRGAQGQTAARRADDRVGAQAVVAAARTASILSGGYTPSHSRTALSRSALPITETEDRLIAAAAIIGLSSRPVNGYRTPGGDRHPERVVDEREEQVLPDVAHGRLGQAAGAHETAEVAFHQRDAGALHGHVGAGAHGDADVGLGERRRVVDAVARHRHDAALACRRLITSFFCSGSTSAWISSMPTCRPPPRRWCGCRRSA